MLRLQNAKCYLIINGKYALFVVPPVWRKDSQTTVAYYSMSAIYTPLN